MSPLLNLILFSVILTLNLHTSSTASALAMSYSSFRERATDSTVYSLGVTTDAHGSYSFNITLEQRQQHLKRATEKLPLFYPGGHVMLPKLKEAFREAISLLADAYSSMQKCDPAWGRYFRPEDWDFVRGVFGIITGDFEDNFPMGSLMFPGRLQIWAGDVPGYSDCADPETDGYTANTPSFLPKKHREAAIGICPKVWSYPVKLADIKADVLGDRDSHNMESLSSVIIHELMHVNGLVSRIPGVDKLLQFQSDSEPEEIDDYVRPAGDTSEPENGVGFYRSMQLRQIKGPYYARSNAENYACLVSSRYFAKREGKEFGPAVAGDGHA